MKIDTDEHHNIRLKEVFSGILLETEEGNAMGVCMRDDTLEINVLPKGENTDNWWRVNMQTGRIENMREVNTQEHRQGTQSGDSVGCEDGP